MNEKIKTTEGTHHFVSPTAKMVAFMRAQSDIPYSAEISRLTGSEEVTNGLLGTINMEGFGAMLELRYKALSALVEEEAFKKGVTNIFEFASGVLPRGIIMSEDKSVHYLETDLPDMMSEKQALVKELGVDMSHRNLALETLNVLDGERMNELAELLPQGPICFINEGLLQYLSLPEKEVAAKNILTILKERGGLWITPDLSVAERMREALRKYPEVAGFLQKINSSTQRDMRANSFGSQEEIIAFFNRIGFELTEYTQKDLVGELSTLKDISNIEPNKLELIKGFTEHSKIWVLRPITPPNSL